MLTYKFDPDDEQTDGDKSGEEEHDSEMPQTEEER